jgi:hypothetical protein
MDEGYFHDCLFLNKRGINRRQSEKMPMAANRLIFALLRLDAARGTACGTTRAVEMSLKESVPHDV